MIMMVKRTAQTANYPGDSCSVLFLILSEIQSSHSQFTPQILLTAGAGPARTLPRSPMRMVPMISAITAVPQENWSQEPDPEIGSQHPNVGRGQLKHEAKCLFPILQITTRKTQYHMGIKQWREFQTRVSTSEIQVVFFQQDLFIPPSSPSQDSPASSYPGKAHPSNTLKFSTPRIEGFS